MSSAYNGYRFLQEVIAHYEWLYDRFTLSFGEIEYLMAERGNKLLYKKIRAWCTRFIPARRSLSPSETAPAFVVLLDEPIQQFFS